MHTYMQIGAGEDTADLNATHKSIGSTLATAKHIDLELDATGRLPAELDSSPRGGKPKQRYVSGTKTGFRRSLRALC